MKAQILASRVYEEDSIFYQGMRLGIFETNGLPWQLSQQMHDRLNNVTAEQVRDVARRYLVSGQSTVAVLVPQPLDEG